MDVEGPYAGKKLSCKRCQHRKLKCSRTSPCTKCTAAAVHCEYRTIDKKRTPASSDYAVSLERRVQSLEGFVLELQKASAHDREAMLRAFTVDTSSAPVTSPGQIERPIPSDISQSHFVRGTQGRVVHHGPTSILRSNPQTEQLDSLYYTHLLDSTSSQPASKFEHVAGHFGIDLNSVAIITGLQNFFKWQYPHFMFIYREAFLRDHFGTRQNCKYWSPALLMAICALGLLMSTDDSERETSARCFDAAESITIVAGSSGSSLLLVQAFLCLAFYEIGRGNLSKGWALSGMSDESPCIAFRMAQDLGLQRDPKLWLGDGTSVPQTEDIEIRRRIYWGCYNSDKLISLTIGRPVELAFNAAQVELPNYIPDGPQMEFWRPAGFEIEEFGSTEQFGGSGVFSNIPYLQQQIMLFKIIEDMIASVFSPQLSTSLGQLDTHIDKVNLELHRWMESVPDFAKSGPKAKSGMYPVPAVTTLHLLFHSIRIAGNLDRALVDDKSSAQELSRQHCASSAQEVIALVRIFRLSFGLQHSSLILVYAAAQALRAVRAFGIGEERENLVHVLEQSHKTWELVGQVLPPGAE